MRPRTIVLLSYYLVQLILNSTWPHVITYTNQKQVHEINQTVQTTLPRSCTYSFARVGGRRDRSHFRFFVTACIFFPDILNCIFIQIKNSKI